MDDESLMPFHKTSFTGVVVEIERYKELKRLVEIAESVEYAINNGYKISYIHNMDGSFYSLKFEQSDLDIMLMKYRSHKNTITE